MFKTTQVSLNFALRQAAIAQGMTIKSAVVMSGSTPLLAWSINGAAPVTPGEAADILGVGI